MRTRTQTSVGNVGVFYKIGKRMGRRGKETQNIGVRSLVVVTF